MESSQEENGIQEDHKERIEQIDSDIHKINQQLLKENDKFHSKNFQSEISKIEISPLEKRPFEPFVANTLKVLDLKGCYGFLPESVAYSEKFNLILGCHMNESLHFYDATTLLPLEGVKPERLKNPALIMSFWPETDTVIFGCLEGHVYAYDLSIKILQKVQQVEKHVFAMAFISSKLFAFAASDTQKLYIGNLKNGDLIHFDLGTNNSSRSLFCLPNKKFLFSSLQNGSVQVYRTDQIPRLPIITSIRFDFHPLSIKKKFLVK